MNVFNARIKAIQRASSKAVAQFTATEKALEKQNEKLTAVVTRRLPIKLSR